MPDLSKKELLERLRMLEEQVYESPAQNPPQSFSLDLENVTVTWPDGSTGSPSGGISDGEDFDGQGTSEFSDLQSLNTEGGSIGEVYHYNPDQDGELGSFVLDHSGGIISLSGQTVRLNESVEVPTETEIRDGSIAPDGDADSSDFVDSELLRTPENSDHEDITLRNLTIGAFLDGEGTSGVKGAVFRSTRRTDFINVDYQNFNQVAFDFIDKHSDAKEAQGPTLDNCRVYGGYGNGPAFRISQGRDYASLVNCKVSNNSRSTGVIEGENAQIIGGEYGENTAGGLEIRGDKTTLKGATLNHGFGSTIEIVDATGCMVQNCRAIIADNHILKLSGAQLCQVKNNTFARADGSDTGNDCIHLENSANRDSKNNTIQTNDLEAPGGGLGTASSRDAIREASGVSGNVIKDNTAYAGRGYTLNSTTNVSGNVSI